MAHPPLHERATRTRADSVQRRALVVASDCREPYRPADHGWRKGHGETSEPGSLGTSMRTGPLSFSAPINVI